MKQFKLMGIPFSFGQELKGVSETPDFIRDYGMLSLLKDLRPTKDLGDINLDFCSYDKNISLIKNENASSLGNEMISDKIINLDLTDSFLLNVGGDHGLALGTIHGLLHHRPDMVVVWADAHGDLNTPETSPSGNFHGMPLSFLLNLGKCPETFSWVKNKLSPQKLIFFGPRSLDPEEEKFIKDLSIQYFSSDDINGRGAASIMKEALLKADPEEKCPIHLSFDVDLLDPQDVHSTGTRVAHGPYLEEVKILGDFLRKTNRLSSMDLVEINPEIGSFTQLKSTMDTVLDFLELTLSPKKRDQGANLGPDGLIA